MRIVAVADTHGLHGDIEIPDGDVLVHAGDLTSHGDLEGIAELNRWIGELPHPSTIVIAGNHDFCLESDPGLGREIFTNAHYLRDEAVTIEGVRFYGSPWQPWFFDWAFNLQRGEPLRRKWDLIPDDTDVLITHGPPRGILDRTTSGELVGCDDLRQAVERIRPQLHIFGHIHEAYGVERLGPTAFVNASCWDSRHRPVNEPVVIDIDVGSP
jgi:Icc-related predicted phosphoesterase